MTDPNDRLVVFDLGGVLIDWEPRRLYRKLFAGDEAAMEWFLAEVCPPAWNLEQDRGRPFAEAIEEAAARHPDWRRLIEAYHQRWIEMIGGPIRPSVDLLEALHAAGRPMVALTNWSAETFPLVRDDPTYGFLGRFDEIFVSGELGMVKPEEAIFRHLLEATGRPAEACYFIDDSPNNVDTARSLGLHAHRFTDAPGLERWLIEHGLLA